jgi:DNA ligase-1
MSSIHETLPTLYGKDISGKLKQWSAIVYTDGIKSYYTVEYGQVGGKIQITSTEFTEGKNIGKKNETTPLQQCCNEIRKKWKDKQEKERYSQETVASSSAVASSDAKVFPMLAHVYDPKSTKSRIVYPCYVQPKLDGLRCLIYKSNDKIVTQTRSGGYYVTMGHIVSQLEPFFARHPTIVLDGELYTTDYPFEELCGLIKRAQADSNKLQDVHFHIYDMIGVSTMTYSDRHAFIMNNRDLYPPTFNVVKTEEVSNIDGFKAKFSEYVQEGYEGIMLRNKNGTYVNNHSHDLQKYKEFEEDEFTIVGFSEARGRDAGSVIWNCVTKGGEKFECRPVGTLEHRKELFRNADKQIGKLLTIKYQELSERGIPRFLSGKAIRDGY